MNAMTSKYLISLFIICLCALAGSAQTNYSESAAYKPRKIAAPVSKKDRKKKSDEKDKVAPVIDVVSDLNAGGDINVTIPVSVLDRSGVAVSGIRKEEVSVFVDGVEVPINTFEQDKEPVTMVLVLDSSPSAQLRFKTMQEQASKLIRSLPSNMKVMVIDFNTKFNVRTQPTTNRAETLAAISKMKMGDGTSIYSAVQFMWQKILPPVPGRKVVVLMTDGVDTTSENSDFEKSLTEVEKEDVTVYPTYFDTMNDHPPGRNISDDFVAQILRQNNIPSGAFSKLPSSETEYKTGLVYLNDLATATGGRIFSSEKLEAGTKSLLGELVNRYYVTITVPRKHTGSRPVRVRVNRVPLAVFARGSFLEK
jgi:VWFA-related protein